MIALSCEVAPDAGCKSEGVRKTIVLLVILLAGLG